jgi:hypothetical protein
MRKPGMRIKLSTRALALALSLSMVFSGARAAQDPGWPREITRDDATLVYYQPQIDEWKDFKEISGRMAISVTPRGGKPQVGIVALQMHTDVDVDSRNALLSKPQITGLTFPDTDPATAKKLDALVRKFIDPQVTLTISVDRLVASAEKKNAPAVAAVKNDPPAIFFSFGPANLLYVDGDPVPAPIKDSDLSFIVNASWPLFVDNATHQSTSSPDSHGWRPPTSKADGWKRRRFRQRCLKCRPIPPRQT